jgi:hypothetical protein
VNAGNAFHLRCDIREAMMACVRSEMPHALPRRRTEITARLPCAENI